MPLQNDISTAELLRLRLYNQRLTHHKEKTPAEAVNHFGAMQAQDYPMAKWAIGARVRRSTENTIQKAIDNAQIIRTHVLRPTWHLVSPGNLQWMLQVTAPRLHAADKARLKQLGITPTVIKKSNRLLLGLLKGRSVTREEIMSAFTKEKIKTSDYRGGHLLFQAEIEGLICNGKFEKGKHTYALFEERIPAIEKISKEDALMKLATLYFQSHGPATAQDFTWWSGLSPADARHAIVIAGKSVQKVSYNQETLYYFAKPGKLPELQHANFLLPAYDEYTIAYKDRRAATESRFLKKTISANGIFYPLVIIEGKIAGLWKKQVMKNKLQLVIRQFNVLDKHCRAGLEAPAIDMGKFYGLEPELKFTKF